MTVAAQTRSCSHGAIRTQKHRACFSTPAWNLTDSIELYAFGNYSDSEGDGSFFYRYPYNGTIEKLREQDGSIYFPLEKFPGGFTPRFFGDTTDYSILGGIKSTSDSGFGWDISARFGDSTIEYTLKNTINPSMGPDSPTSFKPGDLTNQEMQLQADFVYDISDSMSLGIWRVLLRRNLQGRAGRIEFVPGWSLCDSRSMGLLRR